MMGFSLIFWMTAISDPAFLKLNLNSLRDWISKRNHDFQMLQMELVLLGVASGDVNAGVRSSSQKHEIF